MNLDNHGLVGPVTAVCVYGNRILAGCGRQVQVYSAASCDLLTSCSALSTATVHGLQLGPVIDGKKYLCVFGAKCMRIFSLGIDSSNDTQNASHIRVEAATDVREFEDWIWTTVWLQNDKNDSQWTVAVALAYNVVLHWDWQTDTILHRATCVEKCILYCGHFMGHGWSDLVLAAGTVFNQVVLWSPSGAGAVHMVDRSGSEPQPVLHRLTGHQGVIFSIFYHEGFQRICSASDDRSIIMYQLRLPPSSAQSSADVDSVSVDWNHVTIEPMLTVFGHSGRVWDVVLLKDCFVSVGEDAHCIVWNYDGEILHKHKGHRGQSIWSLAASEDESFVVTGGGDCSVRKWQLCTKRDLQLTQTPLTIPDHMKMGADDFVRSVALWDYDRIVLITNAGGTLCYSIASERWQTLTHDVDFASYATLAVSPHTSFLAVGSITGHVRVMCQLPGTLHAVCETKVKVHTGKICGLTWVNDDHFLTTGLLGQCVLGRVQQSAEGGITVTALAKLDLPPCKHRWVVSGCLVSQSSASSSSSSVRQTEMWAHLVCGDRSGSVHCYQLSQSASQTEEVLLPAQTFPKIHGSAGVTCVGHHNHTVYTAGRDGHYRRWSLNTGGLQLLNSSRVCKGFDWIDRLWIGDHGLLILGFYSSKFMVWDADQGEQLLEVECGGGHRSWDCLSRGKDYRMAFVKAREVIVVDGGQKSAQDIVKPPLHGKKVLDMRCLSTHTDDRGVVHHVLCTGSEDTTLSLGVLHSHLEGGGLLWKGQHTLHGHLSSVRAVATVRSASTPPDLAKERRAPHQSQHQASPQTRSADLSPPHLTTDSAPQLSRKSNSASTTEGSVTVVFSAGGRAQIQAWKVAVTEQGKCSEQAADEQDGASSLSWRVAVTEQGKGSEQAADEQDGASSLSLVNEQDSIISHHTVSEQSWHHPHVNAACSSASTGPVSQQQHQRQDVTREGSPDKHVQENVRSSFPSDTAHDRVNNSSVEHRRADKSRATEISQCPRKNTQSSFTTSYEHLGGCFLGESRHKRSHKPWKTRYLKLDPETRIMCLAAVSAQQLDSTLSAHLHLVAAAGSDGALRLFLFDEQHGRFRLLCQSSHHNSCILKVLIHRHPCPHNMPQPHSSSRASTTSLSDHIPFLLSAATNGRIAVWNLQPVVSWLLANTSHTTPEHVASACGDEASFGFKTPASQDKAEAEHAAASGDCEDQELSEDESSEDGDENDGETNTPHCTAMQSSTMTRTQYIGDAPPPLFCPTSRAGGVPRTAESSVVEQKTEGSAAEDRTGGTWTPDQELMAHQSGVNSLHLTSLADGGLLVASGGDDNALTVQRLTVTMAARGGQGRKDSRDDQGCHDGGGPLLSVAARMCRTDAHAAQITGVWILSETHIVTASIDQRVSLWKLTQDSQITLERCCFVNVTDPSNMEIWQHKDRIYVGLCGEGVALLSIHGQAAERTSSV